MKNDKKKRKLGFKKATIVKSILACIIVVVVFVLAASIRSAILEGLSKEEIITKSNLERIISVSELSTFEAVYNGVVTVNNVKKPEKVDYYVAYEGTVKAGIDVKKVTIDIDKINKVIKIVKPKVEITNDYVEPESLDFIFVRKKAETSNIVGEAYPKCQADLKAEIKKETVILEIAGANADTIIRGLVQPFIDQFDAEYKLEIS